MNTPDTMHRQNIRISSLYLLYLQVFITAVQIIVIKQAESRENRIATP